MWRLLRFVRRAARITTNGAMVAAALQWAGRIIWDIDSVFGLRLEKRSSRIGQQRERENGSETPTPLEGAEP